MKGNAKKMQYQKMLRGVSVGVINSMLGFNNNFTTGSRAALARKR
jgi:hypothetical protein